MISPRDWLLEHTIGWVPFLLRHYDVVTGCFHPKDWDERCNNCIYALAYLFVTEHPHNGHCGDKALLQAAIGGGDAYVERQTSRGEWPSASGRGVLAEWTAYFLLETLVLLNEHLDEPQRARWHEALTQWAQTAAQRPLGFTSPASDAWKCTTLLRAGQVLDREEWRELARWQMRELNRQQQSDGYWEEPAIGHGASSSYHLTHLSALFRYCAIAGDAEAHRSLGRGIGFAVSSSYPDGLPIDAMDGRAGFTPAAFLCAAHVLSLHPTGRERVAQACTRFDQLTGGREAYSTHSLWSAFVQPSFAAEAHRYFEEELPTVRPQSDPPASHRSGDACSRRQGNWFWCLDGHVSDLSALSGHPQLLMRQSRISLWHRDWGVVVTACDAPRRAPLPTATCVLSTRFHDVRCDYGEMKAGSQDESSPVTAIADGYVLPRAVEFGDDGQSGELILRFGHGTVCVSISAAGDDEVILTFAVACRGVTDAYIQLPVVLWWDATVQVDDRPAAAVPLSPARKVFFPLTKSVRIASERRNRCVVFRPEGAAAARFHFPVPVAHHQTDYREILPLYGVGLLSVPVEPSAEERRVSVRIAVETLSI